MAWLVRYFRCRRCGHEGLSIHEQGTNGRRLECSRCGAQDSTTRPIRHTDWNDAKRVRA
jgi:transcription elongation factor Elf1